MITYSFLQHYWWFLVSLLGALLVFLMFVQGANSLIFSLGRTPEEQRMVLNSTGRRAVMQDPEASMKHWAEIFPRPLSFSTMTADIRPS